jgi:alpha-mannosidase
MTYHRPTREHSILQFKTRIEAAVYATVAPLAVTAWTTREPVAYPRRRSGRKLTLQPGDKWGNLFDCAWFHFAGRVPAAAAGKQVVLLIDVNGEACVFNAKGEPVQGLTNISSEFDFTLGRPGKRVVPMFKRSVGGEKIDLWADAGCNDLFGKLPNGGTLKQAEIAILNPHLHQLYYDIEVLEELMRELPKESARHQKLLQGLAEAAVLIREATDAEAQQARRILKPLLDARGGDPSMTLSAIGHSHMDLAWLWPIRETKRKCARTFSTVLRMMERYPDYHYGASQPQQYKWTRQQYPSLYRQIRKRITEGRWEAQGSMWVEADTNITSGESLVRQFLYGKRFWRTEFGVESRELWLPDVFGYSGALPQIMHKCGVDYFMTQKLSWSLVNSFPHHSFWWQGIDGTRVLSHMLP